MSDGPHLKLSDTISVPIIDPDNLAPVFADLVTEIRVHNGMLYLSLAALTIDGDDSTRTARVCARLRIAPHTVQFIQQVLAAPSEVQIPQGQTIN